MTIEIDERDSEILLEILEMGLEFVNPDDEQSIERVIKELKRAINGTPIRKARG